ncbi:MAG: DUF2851 family protein [Bacteroidia bacterium]|nr:DUF2851 family protein [Bacteroidia bacterium]
MSLFSRLPEDVVQYVWATLQFDLQDLRSTEGHPVRILRQGLLNRNQGPDFQDARIKISGMEWIGQVEIHVETQDWYRHRHEQDPAYNAVILHVVLHSSGRPVLRQDGSQIPELELHGRIPPGLLDRYAQLQLAPDGIPCAALIRQVLPLHRDAWIQRLAIERVEMKAAALRARMSGAVPAWEQVLWEELAAQMGGPVNAEVFRMLARRAPAALVKRVAHLPLAGEAWLLGAAGLLQRPGGDAHLEALAAEWAHLQHKYQLAPAPPVLLSFLRMRPAAFPTLRLAQLAALIRAFPELIRLLSLEGMEALISREVRASPYWERHYRPGEPVRRGAPALGAAQKQILLVNVLVPAAWLYGQAHGRMLPEAGTEQLLERLPPEHNRHTRPFEALGLPNPRALESQGLIQLHKHYCTARRCLECGIGHQILKRQPEEGAETA